MNELPGTDQLFEALEATWAPHAVHPVGDFRLREGRGGGQRVSSATLAHAATKPDLRSVEATALAMKNLGQTPLFQITPDDDDLDHMLRNLGYTISDPTVIFTAPAKEIAAQRLPGLSVIEGALALELMAELWASGGIGPDRLAVMDRVRAPKAYLLLRHDNQGAGCAFVAAHNGIAMLHALEVSPTARRHGLGRAATAFAGSFVLEHGADWLALATVRENRPACALYESMGFRITTEYHYRRAP